MSGSRTLNTTRNLIFAIASQLMTTILAFITRTALIRTLGIQAVSLNGLFDEVIAMISLSELGVGSAIIYNLYKPLAENDTKKICQLMTFFRNAYRVIALVILGIGLALVPWIQTLVNNVDYSTNYIRVVYVLFVVQTASSYLFAYKTSLLKADQKNYIQSLATLIVKAISVIFIVGVLVITRNYILYLVIQIFFNLLVNIVCAIYVDKHYTYLKIDNSMSKEDKSTVFSNVKNLFIKTLSWRVTNSTDNILISVLVNTLQVGYYSNYNVFFKVVRQLQTQFAGAIAGSLGNLLASRDNKYCVTILNRLTYLFYVLAFTLCLGVYACITPVIELWLGSEYLLADVVVYILCLNLFIDLAKTPVWQVLEVSGLFKKDKNISIIGTVINLIISVVIGYYYGMIGIFLGTLATYLIQLFMKVHLVFKDRLESSPIKYYSIWIFYILSFAASQVIIIFVTKHVVAYNLVLQILVNGCISIVISLLVCIVIFIRTAEFHYALQLAQGAFNKIIERNKRR